MNNYAVLRAVYVALLAQCLVLPLTFHYIEGDNFTHMKIVYAHVVLVGIA